MAEQKACCRLITSTGQIEFVVPWVELVSVEIDRGGNNLNFDKKQRKSSEIAKSGGNLIGSNKISQQIGRNLPNSMENSPNLKRFHWILWKTH